MCVSQVCGAPLSCGNHTCEQVCHDGVCPPCPRSLSRSCPCGKTSERTPPPRRPEPTPPPPDLSVVAGSSLPCTEDVPPCGDTCDRPLSCLKHTCSMRCHRGSCETCRQVTDTRSCSTCTHALTRDALLCLQEVERECRCGKHRKKTACHKEYLCDSKCPKTRNCQRHQCRRKVRTSGRGRSLAPQEYWDVFGLSEFDTAIFRMNGRKDAADCTDGM